MVRATRRGQRHLAQAWSRPKTPASHRASEPVVQFDTLQDRKGIWLVEAERGLPAGAVCGSRGQPLGTRVQKYMLESETAGQVKCSMKNHAATARRRAKTTGHGAQKRLDFRFYKPFSR